MGFFNRGKNQLTDKPVVIAIDGPAGSGKSTTAKLLAEKLDFIYLDSGAMYRAATLKVLKLGIPVTARKRISEIVAQSEIELKYLNHYQHIFLDGDDVSDRIRSQEVTANVSAVSKIPRVREIMVIKQRELAQYKNVVAEGRDMATVVFPDAQLKIYLDASVEERVNRRWRELAAKGIDVSKMQLKTEIVNRDRIDSSREHSPLKRAKDAVFIDTTAMTVTEQVEMIYKQFKNMSKKQ